MFVPMSNPEPPATPTPGTPPPVPIPTGGPIAITGPLGIADLLDRTFRALRARFGVLVLSAALVMVPLGIVTTLISGRFLVGYFDLLQFSMNTPTEELPAEEFFGDMAGYFGAFMLLGILSALASTLVTLMSMHHIQRFLHGETSTVGEGWRAALPRILPMIWMQIIQFLLIGAVTAAVALVVGVVIFGFAVVFGGAIAALDNEAASVILGIGLIVVFIVGYLLLIILILAPSALFMGRWLAAAPSLMIEGLRPVPALRRSWALTKGRWWRGIIFVVLLTVFSMIVIGLPVGVLQTMATLLFPSQVAMITIVATAASYVLNLFYQPFYATGMILFYYDLRVRAEAYDVALRVAALEAEVAPDAPPA
jgi:hypothetical protein